MINPSDIPGIGLFDMDKASIETFGPVVHLDRNGFLYCTRGRIDLALNERVYEIRTGDIYIYPPFSHTYIHEISDDLQCVVGVADFDFVLPVISQVSNARNQVFILENPCISLDGRQRVRIGELIAAVRNREAEAGEYTAAAHGDTVYRQLLSALGQAVCYEIMQAYFSSRPIRPLPQERKDRIFQQFLISLHRNFRVHREVAFYAGQQCLTPRYFSTVVREKTGRSALRWITATVVAEAKKMLSDPALSVKEIADALGFPNQSFFGRYFRQYTGISPTEFRSGGPKRGSETASA